VILGEGKAEDLLFWNPTRVRAAELCVQQSAAAWGSNDRVKRQNAADRC